MNMHVRPPAESLDSFSALPATIQHPDIAALRGLHRLRKEAEAEVERLLIFLDAIDGYTMTEFEPSMTGYSDGLDDREGDQSDDEEHEPSGIADAEGLLEQLSGIPGYHLGGVSVGYSRGVE